MNAVGMDCSSLSSKLGFMVKWLEHYLKGCCKCSPRKKQPSMTTPCFSEKKKIHCFLRIGVFMRAVNFGTKQNFYLIVAHKWRC